MLVKFKDLYNNSITENLKSEFKYGNVHQIPRISKIVINMGVSKAVSDSKAMEGAVRDLKSISGQKPCTVKAKKSIAAFKLREGMVIGCKVTLRRERMFEFLERLVMIALVRVKGFRGLSSKSFDGRGNYTLGLNDHTIFPEISYDKSEVRGMDITIVTTAKTDREAKTLLVGFNLPFSN